VVTIEADIEEQSAMTIMTVGPRQVSKTERILMISYDTIKLTADIRSAIS